MLTRTAAIAAAQRIAAALRPAVRRLCFAGELRRGFVEVDRLAVLLEPERTTAALIHGDGLARGALRTVARELGPVRELGPHLLLLRITEDVPVVLYLCPDPRSWGAQLAALTGPVHLTRHALDLLQLAGCAWHGAELRTKSGGLVNTDTEARFFTAAGLSMLPPHLRHDPAAFRALPAPVPPE